MSAAWMGRLKSAARPGWAARLGSAALLGLAVLLLAATGCDNFGQVADPGIDTLHVSLPRGWGDAQAQLFLYRITSLASGDRLGVGREFMIEDRRQVRAVVIMDGLHGNEPILLHVMFISPTGKKMYTKEVHVQAADWPSAEKREALANDFTYLDPVQGRLEVEARYGVGPDKYDLEAHKPQAEKEFRAGTWQVRVYLFRKLLMQTDFELVFEGE